MVHITFSHFHKIISGHTPGSRPAKSVHKHHLVKHNDFCPSRSFCARKKDDRTIINRESIDCGTSYKMVLGGSDLIRSALYLISASPVLDSAFREWLTTHPHIESSI